MRNGDEETGELPRTPSERLR